MEAGMHEEDGLQRNGPQGEDPFAAPEATVAAVFVARDGAVEVRPMLTMTLTVDHRAVDGAEGADFLRTVKQFVEEPALAL